MSFLGVAENCVGDVYAKCSAVQCKKQCSDYHVIRLTMDELRPGMFIRTHRGFAQIQKMKREFHPNVKLVQFMGGLQIKHTNPILIAKSRVLLKSSFAPNVKLDEQWTLPDNMNSHTFVGRNIYTYNIVMMQEYDVVFINNIKCKVTHTKKSYIHV